MSRSALKLPDGWPELAMPADEADWLRGFYAKATCILEYGSGGSTALAADLPGKTVWSVESDGEWTKAMQRWFAANPPKSRIEIRHVDIGPTRSWGFPSDTSGWRTYPRYPLAVWDAPGFRQPDLVLIDGRFRIGCFLAVLTRTARPVTVLFDDYMDRPNYHVVEDFAGPPAETRGRMARFEIEPRPMQGSELLTFVEAMAVPD